MVRLIPLRVPYLEYDEDYIYPLARSTRPLGPSGSKGHSILKKSSIVRHRANLDTVSDSEPDMGDYHYTSRVTSGGGARSYDFGGPVDLDLVRPSKGATNRMVYNTLDDNDTIQRGSRRQDKVLMDSITDKLNTFEVPPPRHRATGKKVVSRSRAGHGHVNAVRTPIVPTTVTRQRFYAPEHPMSIERRLETAVVDLPSATSSLSGVRKNVEEIKNELGTHRMLVDRYLALDLGPSEDVDTRVTRKYFELAERMPQLEPDNYLRNRTYNLSAPVNTAGRQRRHSVGAIGYAGQQQPVSDVRRNIRKLILKARRDPTYYS